MYRNEKYSVVNFSSHGHKFFLFTIKDGASTAKWSFFVQMLGGGQVCDDYTATINVFSYNHGVDSSPSYTTVNQMVPIDFEDGGVVPECALEIADRKMKMLLAPKDWQFKDKLYFGVSVAIRRKHSCVDIL